MTVNTIPAKLVIMILAARIGTLDVDTDIRSPIIGGKVITVLGNIIAALLEKTFEGEIN